MKITFYTLAICCVKYNGFIHLTVTSKTNRDRHIIMDICINNPDGETS